MNGFHESYQTINEVKKKIIIKVEKLLYLLDT